MREPFVRAFAEATLSPEPDLANAALIIARIECPNLDAGPYLDRLDELGSEARVRVAAASTFIDRPGRVPSGLDPDLYARVMALNDYLFRELRFVGNDRHYEDPRNSCLNEVLDRRTGIPITLALVYMEVARRAGVHIQGINFPGHFLLRCPASPVSSHVSDLIIDAFRGGRLLSEDACREMLREHSGGDHLDDGGSGIEDQAVFRSHMFRQASKPQILGRMLLNLKRLYVRMRSFPQARDVTDLQLAVDPSAIDEMRDRGLLAYHLKDFPAALRDLQTYLRWSSTATLADQQREDHTQIWEHVKTLRKRVASLN